MPISALPTPPSRSDAPQEFSDRADALLGALPGFVTEANALQSDVNAKEVSAASHATVATDKAAEAAASATTASTKASEAAASAVAAAAAASNAESAFDSFDDKYLGSKASDPATDNDGNPLLTGALYWNTTVNEMRVWNGSAWQAAAGSLVGMPETAQELAGGVDLNTIQTPGFYVQSHSAEAASGTNYPVATAGALVVLKNASGVSQLYYTYGSASDAPRAFFRAVYSGSWSPWREIYHSGNLGAASETASGLVELATAAEAQALESATLALTPARLADAFKGANQSLSTNGYQKLPGGLIIQWGRLVIGDFPIDYFGTITFPIAFPNQIFQVNATLYSYAGNAFDAVLGVTTHSLTGFGFTVQEWGNTVQNVEVSYIAIGS